MLDNFAEKAYNRKYRVAIFNENAEKFWKKYLAILKKGEKNFIQIRYSERVNEKFYYIKKLF